MKIYPQLSVLGLCLLLLAGCGKNPSKPVYDKQVTVFGYLWGNEPLNAEHAVSITWSQPLDQTYNAENAAVYGAHVTLTDSTSGESWILSDTKEKPGAYYNESLIIQPGNTYRLRIETTDRTVTASTTVPPALNLMTELSTETVNDETQTNLGYRKPIHVQCGNCSGDVMILVDMFCRENWEEAEYLNPFFGQKEPASLEEYDGGINGEPRHIKAFVAYQDLIAPEFNNEHVIYWYASMIVFYGRQTMQVMTVDNNYMEYEFNEHPAYSGGVHGGIGLFASMCGSTYTLNITGK